MSLPETSEMSLKKELDTRFLFGAAVSQVPAVLYERIGRPEPGQLPFRAMNDIAHRVGSRATTTSLLLYGISDVAHIVKGALDDHGFEGTFDQALPFVKSERSIEAIAILARQRSEMSQALISMPGQTYSISPSENAIITAHGVEANLRHGCPAVDLSNGKEPWPIFNRFIPWAGELALHALYRNNPEGLYTPNIVLTQVDKPTIQQSA